MASGESAELNDCTLKIKELNRFRNKLVFALKELIATKKINFRLFLAMALWKTIGMPELPDLPEPEKQSPKTPKISQKDKNLYPDGVQVKRRGSVVGESITQENLSMSPLFHEKPADVLNSLKEMMKVNALFGHIDDNNLHVIAKAFERLSVEPGEIVVRQHEDGDTFFFVQRGKLNCYVEDRGLVGSYGPGDSFGEASIMYGNKRGATIQVI